MNEAEAVDIRNEAEALDRQWREKMTDLSYHDFHMIRNEILDTLHEKWGNSLNLRDTILVLCSIASHMAYDTLPTNLKARRLLEDGIKYGRILIELQEMEVLYATKNQAT